MIVQVTQTVTFTLNMPEVTTTRVAAIEAKHEADMTLQHGDVVSERWYTVCPANCADPDGPGNVTYTDTDLTRPDKEN